MKSELGCYQREREREDVRTSDRGHGMRQARRRD